ncbi:MAG: carboxypeptidase-like regulatory domain-containing protein, partial [Ilumatobacteraceae bacterium]
TNDWSSSSPVVLGDGEQRVGADIQLTDGVAVAGTVTDGSGTPLSGVNVNVNPMSSGPSAWAQTGPDGTYTTGILPAGDYRVQFSSPGPLPDWATQYWHQQPSWNTADILTIATGDSPVRGGIDAVLTVAAEITGTVTGPGAVPLEGICVSAIINTPNGLDGLANTQTASDGTYLLAGLAPMDTTILFEDCNNRGPYARQLWHASRTLADATTISLSPGATVTSVDAELTAAGSISGTVRDDANVTLAGICVQATTDTFVGGLTQTDGNGAYTLIVDLAGNYRVQFVDCTSNPTHAGRWWSPSPSATPGTLAVAPGSAHTNIDGQLHTAGPTTISGTVRNAAGAAMTSACVVAYLPNQYAIFANVDADGSYTLQDVPSGTWALGFLGCDHGNPSETVIDITDASITYAAAWWDGAAVSLAVDLGGGPDPIAQGATLITTAPDDHLTGFDHCFGCPTPPRTITIDSVSTTGDSITVAFSTSPQHLQALTAPALTAETYLLACTSPTGTSRAVTGPGSPLTVTGVTPGATYACSVTSSGGATAGASASFNVAVPAASSPAASAPAAESPTRLAPASQADASTGTLPTTGVDMLNLLLTAIALCAVGAACRRCTHRLGRHAAR